MTSAITAPTHSRFYAGLGTTFSLGALNKLDDGAVIQEVTGMHVAVRYFGKSTPSVSTQIAALRRLLLGKTDGASGRAFQQVREVRLKATNSSRCY